MSQSRSQIAVKYVAVHDLIANPRNARTHSKHQIHQIAASMRRFGFVNPIIIDRQNQIISGHGRWEAAKQSGLDHVPTILLENLTDDEIRAYILADNRLAEKAGWNKDILAIELQHLITLDDLDVSITGFEVPEIDLILEEARVGSDQDDVLNIHERAQAVTRLGDLWKLGKHRILCGNALQDSSFAELMAARRAAVVFADPPYNVPINQNVCGKGAVKHREFAMASGEMSQVEFEAFLVTALGRLARYSTNGAIHFICMDWRHLGELLAAGSQVYASLLNLCVWVKDNGGMGSFYRSRHELVFVFRSGRGPHRNNVMLGQYKRNRTNVWEYPGVNTLSRQGDEGNLLALHPTVEQTSLIASCMRGASVKRTANLVLLCTTSLYGSPLNQYSRLKMSAALLGGRKEEKIEYECLGTSEGFGSFHFSKDTLRMIETLLGRSKEARKVNSIFGEGVNPLMRKIREGLALLGLPADVLLRHGSKRLVYGIALAQNFAAYLLGFTSKPRYLIPGSRPKFRTELIADFWRQRWLLKRLSKERVLDDVARHNCIYPIRHGAQVELPKIDGDVLELFEWEPGARRTAM
jgi:hypothetical protein